MKAMCAQHYAAVANIRKMLPISLATFGRFQAGYREAGEIIPNDPVTDVGLSVWNYLVRWTFTTLFVLVATSALGQEQQKPRTRSVSPDGKWEFRAGAAGEDENFVIAKVGSDQTSLVLSEEEYVDGLAEAMGRAPGYANIVWAPDSKRFAFNLQPGKGFQTAQFYQLDGNKWRKLDPPESQAAMTAPLDRSMADRKKRVKQKLKLSADDWGWPLMASWQVRKWIDSSSVLLYAHRSAKFDLKNDTEEVNVSFFFTLKFDHVGNWKVTRKSEVPEKGVGGLNAEERKEVNGIENEDRELRGK